MSICITSDHIIMLRQNFIIIISISSFFIIIVTEQTAQLICSGKKSNHKMNLAT